jgi:4-hydroxy-3-methylbut-2-enyl diphosphate reductase IspH
MMTLNHKQMDLVVTGSAAIASNTSHILRMANRQDQNSLSVENRLQMLEQYLDRMVCKRTRFQIPSL